MEERNGVYVIGATSRPDTIDPALLRPGRLDTMAFCDFPDREERLEILVRMAKALNLAPSVSFEEVADRTSNYSGADLQAIINNAQLEAVHKVLAIEKERMDTAAGPGGEGAQESPKVVVDMEMIRSATASSRPSVSGRRHYRSLPVAWAVAMAYLFSHGVGGADRDRRDLMRVYERFANKKVPEERGTRQTMS